MMDALDTGAVLAHVVRSPEGAERVTAGGQFADEVAEDTVVRGAPGLGAQERHGLLCGILPVEVEVLGARVEEHEAGEVGWALRLHVHLGEQREPHAVRSDDVEPSVLHDRGHARHRFEQLLHAGMNLLPQMRDPSPLRPDTRVRCADEVVQMRALGFVEPERATDSFQHGFRDTRRVAALEAYVVLDAHSREQRDLLAAESRNAATTAEVRQPCLLGGESRSPCGEELTDVAATVHASTLRRELQARGVLPLTGTSGTPSTMHARLDLGCKPQRKARRT